MRPGFLFALLLLGACVPVAPRVAPKYPVEMHPMGGGTEPVWECADVQPGDQLVPVEVASSEGLACLDMRCVPHFTVGYVCTDLEDFAFVDDGAPQITYARTFDESEVCPGGAWTIWRLTPSPKHFGIDDANTKGLQEARAVIPGVLWSSDCSRSPVVFGYPKDHPGRRWLAVEARIIPQL